MAVPKRKSSKQRKRQRRAHIKLATPNMQFDVATGEYRLSHHVSPSGMYKGEKVIDDNKEA
ncbi:50S ribosomal protein L32 [Companilactobacillus halodurans]|uniref:Large ribosomal subunit protein bL32 n=1 Tax=Companilactobacillus halodurans TaxID=2584183 RepID=A0A5P0ZW00_9LACO|nr:50S ribosomal protein L32 [Companilactobacillus halodurans]MQS74822.1 50S ribosomal protein L32 [Companilactobacillus halodurans]MQS97217.1 50S ribosomal protein L32 [Companilactobacillus halodurans]